MDNRFEGIVISWLDGYGFLASEQMARRYFHHKEWNGIGHPVPGQRVRFGLKKARRLDMPDEACNVIPIIDDAGVNALRAPQNGETGGGQQQ